MFKFLKKKEKFVDLTELNDEEIRHRIESSVPKENLNLNNSGYADFTSHDPLQHDSISTSSCSSTPTQQSTFRARITSSSSNDPEPTSALGFLGNLASSSLDSSQQDNQESESFSSSTSTHVNSLHTKVENISDKLYHITQKIELLETKLARLERRSGYS